MVLILCLARCVSCFVLQQIGVSRFSVRELRLAHLFDFSAIKQHGEKAMNCNRTTNDNLELFKRLLTDVVDEQFRELYEQSKDVELPPPSRRHQLEMNRLFREEVGGSFIPFPDVDDSDDHQ